MKRGDWKKNFVILSLQNSLNWWNLIEAFGVWLYHHLSDCSLEWLGLWRHHHLWVQALMTMPTTATILSINDYSVFSSFVLLSFWDFCVNYSDSHNFDGQLSEVCLETCSIFPRLVCMTPSHQPSLGLPLKKEWMLILPPKTLYWP